MRESVTAPVAPPTSVPSCHAAGPNEGAGAGATVVALAGAPNAGKSTLFNALTGAGVTMGNWPGTTVEVSRGVWHADGGDMTLIDLPGAYSLDPVSPDEALTRALLIDVPASEVPDVVVAVADAANLTRSLYLLSQLREQPLRVVVALTMADVAAKRMLQVDAEGLAEFVGCPVVVVDPRRRKGLPELLAAVRRAAAEPVPAPRPLPPAAAELDELALEDDRFTWLEGAATAGAHTSGVAPQSFTDRVDRWVTAPVFGPLIFLAVMWVVFQITTTVAAPLQDGLDALFSGPVSDVARAMLGAIGLGGGLVEGLLVDGLIAGVGMVLTFAPLMALMFVLLALLEDSGYLARAAVVTDRVMRSIGLPGRAFLPLVVGFGCNVPAIAATRILPQARQRILTAILVPFTSCSARLTVFVMLGTVFFGRWAGTAVFIMYLLSILFVVIAGFALRHTLWRTMGEDPLVIDLPTYQVPTVRLTAAVAWQRLKGFLKTASGIIVATVIAVWLFQQIPVTGGSFGDVEVADSAYGAAAQAIAPVFEPAGFGQWQTVSALVVGFVAKEAVISSWAQTYAVAEPDGSNIGQLGDHITQAFAQSSGGHTLPAVAAFMVFLLAYTPCVATLAAQRREIGLKWTIFGVVVQLVTAWVAAVAVFQIGKVFW